MITDNNDMERLRKTKSRSNRTQTKVIQTPTMLLFQAKKVTSIKTWKEALRSS